ncbi:branched-chain amino acid ABC transporter permease [Synergistales bacterium]|nr:branched-chain amino acid ABC transporter permease [Synergistales bacterium]
MNVWIKGNDNKIMALITLILGILVPIIWSESPYTILVGCYIINYSIAISGFDVLVGFSGQISLGHAAYYCIGAYGSAMLHKFTGIPVFFTMLIATVGATIIGSLIAWPTTKLVEHFMALATIAFGMIVFQLINTSPGRITGDANGFYTVSLSLFDYEINTYTKFYYFSFIVLLFFLLIKYNLLHSRVGRAMLAIRENDHAANGMGVNVRYYKIIAFAVSAFTTAYAGALFAHLMKYISPDSFRFTLSVMFLTMLLFGGASSMSGPIIGVTLVSVLNEILRPASSYKMLVYGVLLLFVILIFPGGMVGILQGIRTKLKTRGQ